MEFKQIDHYPKSQRGKAFQKKVMQFTENFDKLFNVFNKNELQRKKMEKLYKLRMNDVNWAFYHDQCGPRIGKCYSVNEEYSQSDLRYIARVNKEISTKEYHDQPSTSTSNVAAALGSCSDSDSTSQSSEFFPPPAKRPSIQNRQSLTNLALICERFMYQIVLGLL